MQFKARMLKVEQYIHYEIGEGKAMEKLGRALFKRADLLKNLEGKRLPK